MKILYVTTISNTVNTFLIPHIKMLIDEGHRVDVAFNIEQEVNPEIYEMGCKIHQLPLHRSPLKKDNMRAYKKLKGIIVSESYDLVHTHTPVASAIVRLACRKLSGVRVFYTAHGFHFFKGAPILNWLTYYPVEKWLARHTDTLITINKEDYEIAKKFESNKIEYVPGVGIDTYKFKNIEVNKSEKRKLIGVSEDDFMIISVGELNKNKNHQVILWAIAKLRNEKIKYVLCGQGPLATKLRKLSNELGIENQVKFLGFRKDIPELMNVADLFAFPSFREGLSLSLMEAMASGLPVLCSKIRGNTDLIEDGKGGYLVKPSKPLELSDKINNLFKDRKIGTSFADYNRDYINEFSITNVIDKISQIYKEM